MEKITTSSGASPPGDGWSAKMRAAHRRKPRQALCCACGTIRLTSLHGGRATPEPARYDPEDGQADARCTIVRKCMTCGTQTTHAYLRDGEDADYIERRQPYPALDEVTEAELLEVEIDALRADGVRVTDRFISERITVAVSQYLDDGVWVIVLNPDAGPGRRRAGLHKAQSVIEKADDHRWFVEPPDPEHLDTWKRFLFLGRMSDDDGPTQLARN